MKRKFVLWVTVINLIVMATVAGFTFKVINDDYRDNVIDSLKKQCAISSMFFEDSNDYIATAKLISEQSGNRVTVISAAGVVLADSEVDLSTLGLHDSREEVQNARKNEGIGFATRYSDTIKKDVMYVAMTLDNTGTIVRIAQPLENVWVNISDMWGNIALIFISSIIAITLFTIWVMSRIVSPVNELIVATTEITNGNFKKRVFVRGEKEINELATSFNQMTEELERAIGGLKDENSKLDTVLNAIGNGVIAVDNQMRVIMINERARKLLHIQEQALTKNVLAVSRNATIEALLKKCIYEDASYKKEIKTIENGKEIELSFSIAPMDRDGQAKGAVAVIEDVTELRKLESVRSEFAANVSHELKTPLTVIRGFVETLQEGAINDEAQARKFLDIINIETDRLTRLISDILYLSEIESGSVQVELNKLNVVVPAKEVVELLSQKAKEKNISLSLSSQADVFILGNRDRIKQMILNLIDNAIKYTNEGGSVAISLYDKNGDAYIEVKDTGVGIAEKDLGRLFERFYRADKSRSRELGGTGLGLAIVKHIALLHGGKVSAESKLGVGTTFKIIIPGYTKNI